MSESLFMICLRHPLEEKPYVLMKVGNRVFYSRYVRSILRYSEIVAYNFEECIDQLRDLKPSRLPKVVDIVTAKKLLTGRPKSDYKVGNEPWILKGIIREFVSRETLMWLHKINQLEVVSLDTDENFLKNIADLLNGFNSAWAAIEKDLNLKDEKGRFTQVEVPIYNLFLRTQLDGLVLSQDRLIDKLLDLKTTRFSSIKRLELDYNFVSQKIISNMKWEDVRDYTSLTDISTEMDYDFWEFTEIYSEYDDFLKCLLVAKNASMDYSTLLKYSVSAYKYIYPEFDVLGTVTGRILVTKPGIQYLKKTCRAIFTPREGKIYIYADFDQFEPGIIASFSKDPKLINLYNKGDVYSELSILLFGTKNKRKIAKTIFLAFLYGISKERLGKLIVNLTGQDEIKAQGLKFFSEFKSLAAWKDQVCNEAKEKGYTATISGNRRYLREKGEITEKEKRWVPNQIIQGTASYIFKISLLTLSESMNDVGFLIPMHDAILLEVPMQKEKQVRVRVERVFKEVFAIYVPKLGRAFHSINLPFDYTKRERVTLFRRCINYYVLSATTSWTDFRATTSWTLSY